MTCRMAVVPDGQLSASVGQKGNANFLRAFLDDVIDTAPGYLWQILAIRVAWPILNRAGHTHIPFGLRKPRRNLGIIDRPVFTKPVQICCLEIDVAEACRGT